MKMPAREIPVTLVCAGNRRKEENLRKQTIGFNWGAAGHACSVWKGVLLRDVLLECGVKTPDDGANHVCFVGAESMPKGRYGTSINWFTAMDPACDVMLAYEQNGAWYTAHPQTSAPRHVRIAVCWRGRQAHNHPGTDAAPPVGRRRAADARSRLPAATHHPGLHWRPHDQVADRDHRDRGVNTRSLAARPRRVRKRSPTARDRRAYNATHTAI